METNSLLWTDLASKYSEHYYNSNYNILPVYKLITILSSITFFHIVYMCASPYYTKKENLRKRESFVSLCHSTLASILASYILLYRHSLWSTTSPVGWAIPIQFCDIIFSITFGYFAWDVYISFKVEHPIDFKIHALFCTLVYSFATFTPYLHRPAVIVLLFEISTIFLHLSNIATSLKKQGCAVISKLLFAITFFIFRIIIGSFVTYELWAIFVFESVDVDHKDVPSWFYNTILLINLLFHCLNIYWFCYIVKVAANSIASKDVTE